MIVLTYVFSTMTHCYCRADDLHDFKSWYHVNDNKDVIPYTIERRHCYEPDGETEHTLNVIHCSLCNNRNNVNNVK